MKIVGYHKKNAKSYGSNTYRKPQQPSDFSTFILNQKLGKYLSEYALPIEDPFEYTYFPEQQGERIYSFMD